jgi:hypothetical protein
MANWDAGPFAFLAGLLSVTKHKHAVLGFWPVHCLYKHHGVLG